MNPAVIVAGVTNVSCAESATVTNDLGVSWGDVLRIACKLE